MKVVIEALQPLAIDVRVDLGGGNVGVAQKHLHGAKVGAVLQQVRREGMPDDVRESAARMPACRA
jgi:hypothetical protein